EMSKKDVFRGNLPRPHRSSLDGATYHPGILEFSAVICRGLIEATVAAVHRRPVLAFSAVICRGLIEALGINPQSGLVALFSAVICRGLIEAPPTGHHPLAGQCFPR